MYGRRRMEKKRQNTPQGTENPGNRPRVIKFKLASDKQMNQLIQTQINGIFAITFRSILNIRTGYILFSCNTTYILHFYVDIQCVYFTLAIVAVISEFITKI